MEICGNWWWSLAVQMEILKYFTFKWVFVAEGNQLILYLYSSILPWSLCKLSLLNCPATKSLTWKTEFLLQGFSKQGTPTFINIGMLDQLSQPFRWRRVFDDFSKPILIAIVINLLNSKSFKSYVIYSFLLHFLKIFWFIKFTKLSLTNAYKHVAEVLSMRIIQ